MEFVFSSRFKKDYKKFGSSDRDIIIKKLKLLAVNQYHPSLRTKKVKGTDDIFECSMNMAIRITWQYQEDTIYLRAIGQHDVVLKNP